MIITIERDMENERRISRIKGGIGRIMTPKIATTLTATKISPCCCITLRKFIAR
jgi:hypothetical protein